MILPWVIGAVGVGMPVHGLIRNEAFEPEMIELMGSAYEAACLRLGAAQPATVLETVAKRIIEAAHRGERDPEALTAFALRGLDGRSAPR
jgi:hypothetical protein